MPNHHHWLCRGLTEWCGVWAIAVNNCWQNISQVNRPDDKGFSTITCHSFTQMNSTTNQPNLLELAKQGNAHAIATLMNRQLQPKGITAKAALKYGCLQIMLESVQVPNQQALVAFVHKGITGLGAASIKKVKVYGCQAEAAMPAWRQEFELAQQQLSPNSTAAQSVTTTTRETQNKLIAKTQLKAIIIGNIILDWVNLSAKPFAINTSQKFEQLPKLPKIRVIGTSAVLLVFGVQFIANPNQDSRFNQELYTLLESSTNPESVTTQKKYIYRSLRN